jgi:hypothetical protein
MSEASTATAEVVKPSIPAPKPDPIQVIKASFGEAAPNQVNHLWGNRYRAHWFKEVESGLAGLIHRVEVDSNFIVLHDDGRVENRG